MRRLVKQPVFWCWMLVGIWLGHVAVTFYLQRWDGMTISLLGALAALMIASSIQRRRLKNLHSKYSGKITTMHGYLNQPLFWCWLFVVIGLIHVVVALIYDAWGGLTISLLGFFGALVVAVVIQRRRYKNTHPKKTETVNG
jgi:hypothetical protein